MIEQWKRLIEAERRLAKLESTLQRTNRNVTAVRAAVRNDGQNVTNPFGTGGGGGGMAGIHRFPVAFSAWVTWSTTPSLITGASSNVPADGPALASAAAKLIDGFALDPANVNSESYFFGYERNRSLMAQYCDYDFRGTVTISSTACDYGAFFKVAIYDDGQFLADAERYYSGLYANLGDLFLQAEDTADQAFRLEIEWPRRNGAGTVIDRQTLVARRKLSTGSTFSTGPTYGESGTWSFEMEAPATSYHTAGAGTIYLRWGSAAAALVAGGTPGSLPTDFIEGGTPGSLPTDFIEGGLY